MTIVHVPTYAVRGRTADTSAGPSRGAEALAEALGDRLGDAPVRLGSVGEPRAARYDEDLRDARPLLHDVRDLVLHRLADAQPFVLTAGDCSIAVGTLPALAQARGNAKILWLDAHGDYNTPATSGSGYLGGMCLAGACGAWATGFDDTVDPANVVLAGVRDLDSGERELLAASGATVLGPDEIAAVVPALGEDPVFIHLDVDVLDPQVMPATPVPAPGGLSVAALAGLFAAVKADRWILGIEITAFDLPDDPDDAAGLTSLLADAAAALFAPR